MRMQQTYTFCILQHIYECLCGALSSIYKYCLPECGQFTWFTTILYGFILGICIFLFAFFVLYLYFLWILDASFNSNGLYSLPSLPKTWDQDYLVGADMAVVAQGKGDISKINLLL